ncbi:MAG: hypothetical protein ACM3YE_04425 [Bacteroidota bacterium]
MAGFDGKEVLKEMLAAAKASIGDSLPETLKYVEEELKKLANEIAKVETNRMIGEIDKKTAGILTDSLINAAKTVKAAGEGIVKVRAEQAINAALAVLVKAIKAVA